VSDESGWRIDSAVAISSIASPDFRSSSSTLATTMDNGVDENLDFEAGGAHLFNFTNHTIPTTS
jgi:hypothetical protein